MGWLGEVSSRDWHGRWASFDSPCCSLVSCMVLELGVSVAGDIEYVHIMVDEERFFVQQEQPTHSRQGAF